MNSILDLVSVGDPCGGGSDWKLTEREIAEPSKNGLDIYILIIGM